MVLQWQNVLMEIPMDRQIFLAMVALGMNLTLAHHIPFVTIRLMMMMTSLLQQIVVHVYINIPTATSQTTK